MKKLFSILLVLALCLSMISTAFAATHPSENAPADEWERFADSIRNFRPYDEVAEAYKIAADKYSEYVAEEIFYFGPASSCYKKAIELFEYEKMYDKALECYEALGDVAYVCEHYQEAITAFSKAKEIADDLSIDDNHKSVLFEKLGDSYLALENYNDAASEYLHAIDAVDSSREGYAALCLKYAKALEAEGSENDPDREEGIGRAFETAAGEFLAIGSYEEAVANMRSAAEHFDKADRKQYSKVAYYTVIAALAQAGKTDMAVPLCFEAYEAYGADKTSAALFTNIVAPYYDGIKDYSSAALAYSNAGDCYKETGDKDMAKACYQEAAEYYEKAGDAEKANAMKQLAGVGSILSEGNIKIIIPILIVIVVILVALIVNKRKKQG